MSESPELLGMDNLTQHQPDWYENYEEDDEDDGTQPIPLPVPVGVQGGGIEEALAGGPGEAIEDMSVSGLSAFFLSKGIPKKYCEVFEDHYIDGTEFMNLSESDVTGMVPPIGLHRKIIRFLPTKKQSWSDKLQERLRNVVKRDSLATKRPAAASEDQDGARKRRKKTVELLRRYPLGSSECLENPDTVEEHKKALAKELEKPKPRKTLILSLMKSTYGTRRTYILEHASSVSDLLDKYPAISYPYVLEQEMGLIFQKESFKSIFLQQWSRYVPAIIQYAEQSPRKSVKRKITLEDISNDLSSLKILSQALGKGKQPLVYFYEEYRAMDTPERACSQPPQRTQPRIAALSGEGGMQYFIICEQRVLCKAPSLDSAIFLTVATYYCYNLEYPAPVKGVLNFFQDYILDQPDSSKKTATYLATVSDIKRNVIS